MTISFTWKFLWRV